MSSQTDGTPASESTSGQRDAVFLRKASGVIRTMRSRDAMYYGYLTSSGLYAVILYALVIPATFPRANILAAILVPFGIFMAAYFAYACLGSAMPRSGGDWVFTSRLLHPAVGFAVGWVCFMSVSFFYNALGGTSIVTGVISPLFSAIGVATGNSFWTNAADKVQLWYIKVPISFALILLAAWIMLVGMKKYIALQKWFFMPASVLGLLVILGSFVFVSQATFFQHFNNFQAKVSGMSAGNIVQTAHRLGYGSGHSVLVDTVACSAIFITFYCWTLYSTELLGEIKEANHVRTTFEMYVGAGVLQVVTVLIGIYGLYAFLGRQWLGSFSWLALNQPDKLGGAWGFRGVATLFYLPTYKLYFGIIIFIAVFAPIFQTLFNATLATSRLLLAMSFDRVLPSWIGGVNKHGVPAQAIWFMTIGSLVAGVSIEFVPSLTKLIFWANWASSAAIFVNCLSAVLILASVTGRAIWEVSPGARYTIFGIPSVIVCGAIGLLLLSVGLIAQIAYPGFGMISTQSGQVGAVWTLGVAVVAAVAYYVIRAMRRNEGINVDYAFQAIPRA